MNNRYRIFRGIAKLIWLPVVIMEDYVKLGILPTLKRITHWLRETRTEQEISHDTEVEIWSRRFPNSQK